MNSRQCRIVPLDSCLAASAFALALVASAAAQPPAPPETKIDAKGYKYFAPFLDPAATPQAAVKARQQETSQKIMVQNVLSNKVPLDTSTKIQFDLYFSHMFFPKFTHTTDAALKELPVERHRLLRDNLEACTVKSVHDYLADKVLTQMKEIVLDAKFHPACRYNAMLAISGLNDVEAVRIGANRTTPEPMMAALPFIFEQFTKADNNDAIKMAAMLGLVRHLEWDNFRGPVEPPFTPAIPQPIRDAIVSELVKVAQAKDPPAKRSAEGHEWFRRRAIEGLTHAGYYRVDPAVAGALDSLVKDEKEPLPIRCAAATAIGKVVYQAPATLDPKTMAKELGYLALVACDKELTRVTALNKAEEDKLQRSTGAASYGGSAMPGEGTGGMPGGMRGRMGMGMPGGRGGGVGRPVGEGGSGDGGGGIRGPRGGLGGPLGAATGGGGAAGTAMIAPGPGRSGAGGVPGPGGRGGMPGDYGGFGAEEGLYEFESADAKQYRFDLIRRRIRSQLYAVEVGLSGPDANLKSTSSLPKPGEAAPANPTGPPRGLEMIAKGKPEDVAVVEDIKAKVGKLVEVVELASFDFAELEKNLRKHMKPLEAATRKLAAPAASAPAEPVEDIPGAPAAPGRAAAPGASAPGAAAPPPAAPNNPAAPAPNAPAAAPGTPPAAPGTPAPGTPPTPAPGAPG